MKTETLERFFSERNMIQSRLAADGRALRDAERRLCMALIQEQEDQVREQISGEPTEFQSGMLAMSRACLAHLEHSTHWPSLEETDET